ncbi:MULTISPECIES: putative pilus assembly protein FilE [Acinetobacter]|uniref:putative pilus assembly protein FilE n=1 Tax=Acinetobacter TaxID=469 RepID=UPI001D183C68|nr:MULTISPECIES: putative pilus assembly protein FilE [Acinetobacter]MEC6125602.1 putative pilus assembly protein FilE [Acinetobacter ursingii]
MFKSKKSMAYVSWVLFSLGTVPMGYAADFFTIIGPDGRPLVIPRDPVESKKATYRKVVTEPDDTSKVVESKPVQATRSESIKIIQPQVIQPDHLQKEAVPITAKSVTKTLPETIVQQKESSETKNVASAQVQSNQKQGKQAQPAQSAQTQTQAKVSSTTPQTQKVKTETHLNSTDQPPHNEADQHIDELNGEKYIDSEYLEEKEFNLEGKKRFYVMPEGIVDARLGAVRMQPEQREKGVNKSFLQSMLKKNQNEKAEEVLALSSTYYRMPKEQVVESLETACFTGKKMKDAKLFNVEKQIGLWPRKPIKDTFDYDVVKLSAPLKQLKLTSYATTEQNPTFYWPFVVFLDQKGCILEGVSGYKNQEFPATMLQHAAIEGTIRLPDQTSYILLTPLASALDVQEKSLSNQGQIKLTAIR